MKFPTHETDPPQVNGFHILRLIGSGSYGEVWLARNRENQFCALKIVDRSAFENERPFEREYNGIQKFVPVSRHHASQVAILEVGRNDEDGYFYYAMELADHEDVVSGFQAGPTTAAGTIPEFNPTTYRPKTLKSILSTRGRLPVAQCIEIGLSLATALDHLHRHGLLHRDIKPSNVIFVNGVPKLADIGLVTDMESTISYVGTEGFLPPEGPGTPQADLYSLGKVLYEISTGLDRLEFPELPSMTREPAADSELLELNLVFLKACQNDISRRYQTARELSADLALLQAGKSLRRSRQLEHRLAQGKKVSVAVVLMLLLAWGVYYFVEQKRLQQLRAESQRQERDKEVAEQVALDTKGRLAMVYAGNADQAVERGDFYGALVWLGQAELEQPSADARKDLFRRISKLGRALPPVSHVVYELEGIGAAAMSGDDQCLATAGAGQPVKRWFFPAPTGETQPLPLECQGHSLAVDQHGFLVALWGRDGMIYLCDERWARPVVLPSDGPVVAVDFRLEERRIVTATRNGNVVPWDTSNSRKRFEANFDGAVTQLALSPDTGSIAVAGEDGAIQVWDINSGDSSMVAAPSTNGPCRMAWGPDSRRLAFAHGDRVQIWSAASRQTAPIHLRHGSPILSLAFSPDGDSILTGGTDGMARIWHAVTGSLRNATPPLKTTVRQVIFNPDGRLFATVTEREWQLWSVFTGLPWAPPVVFPDPIQQSQFTHGGDRAVITGGDGTVRVVEILPEPFIGATTSTKELSFPTSAGFAKFDPVMSDWRVLARYWAGRKVDHQGRLSGLTSEEWNECIAQISELKAQWGWEDRGITWREMAARNSADRGEWFASWFHWSQIAQRFIDHETALQMADQAWDHYLDQAVVESRSPERLRRIPPRDAIVEPRHLDLSLIYNASLDQTWFPTSVISFGNDLSDMPRGVVLFHGIAFDARGVIQLAGTDLENLGGLFPGHIREIPVHQKGSQIHFLHGLAGDALFGTRVGQYVVHYANGQRREIDLVYGENIRDWWFRSHQPELTTRAVIAWQGENEASRQLGMSVRVYQMRWNNPIPDQTIESLSFSSTMQKPAPFLIAVTLQ